MAINSQYKPLWKSITKQMIYFDNKCSILKSLSVTIGVHSNSALIPILTVTVSYGMLDIRFVTRTYLICLSL